jgi:1-acyl-sn-glycerol-3-phosphate acyltransferase
VLLKPVSYVWRLFITGLAFVTLGVGGFLLAITIIPAARLFVRDSAAKVARTQTVIHRSFQLYILMLRVLGVIRLETIGAEKLPARRVSLIVANHPTLLDVVLIMALIPRACCVVKHQLWRHPFLGPVVRAAGYIRNDHEWERFIDDCRRALAAGRNLIIFPEGTRTVPGAPFRLQRGFAHIATLTRTDLQVVTITCNPVTLLKGQPWYDIPVRAARFRIEIDHQIAIEPFLQERSRAIGVRRLVSHLEAYYAGKLEHG